MAYAKGGRTRRPARNGAYRVWLKPDLSPFRLHGPVCEGDNGYKCWTGAGPNPPYEVDGKPREIATALQ